MEKIKISILNESNTELSTYVTDLDSYELSKKHNILIENSIDEMINKIRFEQEKTNTNDPLNSPTTAGSKTLGTSVTNTNEPLNSPTTAGCKTDGLTLGTNTNDPLNSPTTAGLKTLGTSGTSGINGANYPLNSPTTAGIMYSEPIILQVNELNDSIEMIYEETSLTSSSVYPSSPLGKRHFKIVFSCVDGKWNKSERIYGKKIEGFSYFEFE